jgi:UDP-glucose-4-epimerase GalE
MTEAVLVAGGAGYIGSHVCKALHKAGYLPVVLDDLSAGKRDFVKWGPLFHARVTDEAVVADAVGTHAIRSVIDLAGSIEVAESVRDPLKYYDNNVSAKVVFLNALAKLGMKAFVFSSTAAVYGEPETVPIPEDHRRQPKNPYGWTKLMFEQMLKDFHGAGGPAWMALRYFNAAGASPDGEIGEAHDPESHLIPRACLATLGKIPELQIFGDDYPTPDGTAIRDYVHVDDLASAHVAAVGALLKGQPPAAYNLGNGQGTSIGEILRAFEALGHKVPHKFGPRRAGDPARLVADSSAACRDLGWVPAHPGIQDIVASAYAWHERIPS